VEVTDGVAYSIGSQYMSYTATDPCNCLAAVYINGEWPPVFIADGATIDVTIETTSNCTQFNKEGPTCVMPSFYTRVRRGRMRTYMNIRAIAAVGLIKGRWKRKSG
jgi:hypothetical protein